MSIIPLHLQRRFEQRWAAQFGSQVFPAVPKTAPLKGSPVNIAPRVAKAKEKPAGVESAGVAGCNEETPLISAFLV
jgi:hypothetical protein